MNGNQEGQEKITDSWTGMRAGETSLSCTSITCESSSDLDDFTHSLSLCIALKKWLNREG